MGGADGAAPCCIGIVMPSIGAAAGFPLVAAFPAVVSFPAVVLFFTAVLFFAAGFFSGIGLVMPGMCCAGAGAETVANASALAAASERFLTA
jgi:hypothetical protein